MTAPSWLPRTLTALRWAVLIGACGLAVGVVAVVWGTG